MQNELYVILIMLKFVSLICYKTLGKYELIYFYFTNLRRIGGDLFVYDELYYVCNGVTLL